jgi:hypothetical protein
MLREAKILIRSAPRALKSRTRCRMVSGEPPLMEPNDVRIRGPGIAPRAIASRRSLSSDEPGLCSVVTPERSVIQAFPAAASAPWTGVSPSLGV